jgi:uncharacterized protein (DUF885 family)
MTRRIRTALVCAWLLGLCVAAGPARGESPEAVAALHALFEEAWEYDLAAQPLAASYLGDQRYNDRWPDLTLNAITRRHLHDGEMLVRLARIDRTELPPAEQLDHELFRREYAERVKRHEFRSFLMPINQRGGVQTANEVTQAIGFTAVGDYADWIARLRALGLYVDQTIALLEQGIAEGIVQPRVIMERIPDQIAQQIVADPTASPFYAPFLDFPASVTEEERENLQAIARQAIAEVVLPAYKRLQRFFNETYLPACRDTVGAWDLPRGRELYEFLARSYTTTSLSPDEIHAIGVAEVARIRAEMDDIITAVEFEGSFDEFLEHLRSDPRFYYDSAEDLLQAYRATAKRIDPGLVSLFGKLPRMPYGVRPIPEAIAPDTTTAYYQRPAADGSRAGYYYVNLYRPEVRPKYEIEVLTVHEAMPGHHLQIALAQELDELPAFRRYLGFTAFVEGWALYSESLGEELGLYTDPYSRFGQLTYDMWRAVRLVVDTGLHYRGWSRDQAIEYFKANAAKTEHDIINEIDRYIAWPGQALAYKIGQLKILELRRKSEAALGEAFDVRSFHDTVLGAGAVPLDVLEANVHNWLAARQAALEAP